ncbi:proclotting enzyme-like [Atheta coriaria]|uniref:proclotting enzyme-like n=1 Tax=Dalotia coriaria TaxID=877792 RepID=UPI0031F3FBD8
MRGRAFYKSNFVQEDDIARRDRAFADREFSRVAEEKRQTRNKKNMRATCAFFCLLLAAGGFETGSNAKTTEDDRDTIIVEAENVQHARRARQIFPSPAVIQPYHHPLLASTYSQLDGAAYAPGSGPCFSTKGLLGRCVSFRECYPYFKLPDLNNWDSWVLGMYDTCSYYTQQGRQMFGVCCNAPQVIKPEVKPESTTEAVKSSDSTPASSENNGVKYPAYPNIPNWPPPIPTHPPDHTIPPLPTHPPSPGFPGIIPDEQPTSPVSVVRPTNPPWKPTTPKPPRPVHTTTTESNTGVFDGSCGAKNGYQDQERIVGGHNADIGEWPWIAALFNGGRQFCGGSLIDDVHILTAAHCVAHMTGYDVARLTVRLADHNIKIPHETRHVEKRVKRVVRHRGFDSRTLYNDIALLTLDSPVQFSKQIRPVCLPAPGSSYESQTATVIGWGSLREMGPQPAILQEVNIPIWRNSDCRVKYGGAAPGGIVDHMLCAGQDSRDSCSGDSGGPLMVNNGKWTQVGIVSWGIGCGKGQYPGVYTRVEKFLPWIQKNMNN